MVEGRKIHAFLAAQKDLRQISRPDISAVPGNWVGYPQTMSTLPADVSETHSTFQHFGRGNFGNIQSIDVRTRIMDVLFLYNKVEGANSKSGAKFELVKMPYDHPLLDFYTTEPLPKPDQGYWVNYAEEGEHHWLPFKPYTDRPDLIEDTLGYKVGMRTADAADEGALYPGRVVAFDRIKETVSILFDPSSDTAADANTDPDQENVHWKSADIQWLMPATVSRPKTIEEAVGYNVEVNKAESTVEAHRAVRGTVIGYDRSRQTVRVVYAPPPGQAEATQVENLAFVSPLISWLNKVPLDQVPRSPRPYFPHAGPSYSKLVATTRPGDILSTVGHLVEVRSSDPDAEPGDMFSGVVIAADSSAGTVRILFDSLDKGGSRSRRQSIDAVQQAEGPDVSRNHAPAADDPDEDFEDFPWMSDDILWVIPESVAGGGGNGSSDGGIPIIDSRRPRTLADAVGLHVDVLSREPDAVEGDYFSGTVISVDDKQQTLRVLFDGEDNGDDDFEDIPWNSQDIHWVTEESLRGVGDALSQADSVSLMGPAQDSKDVNVPVRPTTVTEALGRAVKVGAEFTNGDIASVDAKSGAVWVVFNSVANAPAPVQVKIHWQAPHIEWLDSKPLAVVTPLPSPSGKAQLSSPPVEAATAEASLAPAATSTALAAATTSPVQPTTPTSGSPNKKLTRPLNLASSVGWTVEIRTSEAEDEVYVGEVAGYEEATQVVKVLFAGEDGALQQDDAEFFPFDSEKLHWVEAPEGQQQQMQIQMQVQQEGQQQPAEQAAALATTALATSEAAATADEKKVGSEKSPTTAAAPTAAPTAATPVVLTGEPASIEEAVGRHVNIVLDYVPGVVEAVSQALQTVNVTLENSSSSSSSEKLGMSETLILGLPLNSSMIEWDAK